MFPCSETQVRNLHLQDCLHSHSELLSVHSVQVDLHKRVLMHPVSSVRQAASKNRGMAFHKDSEILQDDWEREITQNCSSSQDLGIPWDRTVSEFTLSRNS